MAGKYIIGTGNEEPLRLPICLMQLYTRLVRSMRLLWKWIWAMLLPRQPGGMPVDYINNNHALVNYLQARYRGPSYALHVTAVQTYASRHSSIEC